MINEINHELRRISIKTYNWEYWPMWMVYFPVGFYYLYLSFRARSFFFFSAANPSIETGGMFFESKWKIFQLIPQKYFPITILINADHAIDAIKLKMDSAQLKFPVIAKPDRGERGWGVKKINDFAELEEYKKNTSVDFLIQDYVSAPLEFSVFYFRQPDSLKGIVTSVTLKKLLTVEGDGISTIAQLILKNPRSFLQYKKLKNNKRINMDQILEKGEEQVLVPYGNHVLGAMFLNYNHIIDEDISDSFDIISKQIDGFYYGRFDIRCNSIDDLKKGINLSILELNGAGAEPAHIYHPGFSFYDAQRVLAKHYKLMFRAAIHNKMEGFPFMDYHSFKEFKNQEKEYKKGVLIQ